MALIDTRDLDPVHMLGRVHSLESFGTVDGPGTRFVVFLQGCLFRCRYCHNRDTWDLDGGKLYSVADLLKEILPYKPFMKASGGGVTVTGGEPLLQIAFVRLLFEELQREGIHCCLDTNGYAGKYGSDLDIAIDNTDLVLLDIKHINNEGHKNLVGVSNERTLRFARYLAERQQAMWVRYVVVPGYNDDEKSVYELVNFVADLGCVEKVELLPYHELGTHKWAAMGDNYTLRDVKPPTKAELSWIADAFNARGLRVVI